MTSHDPVEDAAYHFDMLARELIIENRISEQIEEKRTKVLQKIGMVVGEQYAEDFAAVLSFSWCELHKSALSLAFSLHLGEEDFAAIEKDFHYFEGRSHGA